VHAPPEVRALSDATCTNFPLPLAFSCSHGFLIKEIEIVEKETIEFVVALEKYD